MELLKKLSALYLLLLAANSFAQTSVSISLKNGEEFLPASDLGMSSLQAWHLHQEQGVDLSTLNPIATNFWAPMPALGTAAEQKNYRNQLAEQGTASDQAVAINAGDLLGYAGVLEGNNAIANVSSGLFKFSAIGQTQDGPKPLTMVMHKNLHAILLKKELLRRLGYVVQGLKWLPQVRVKFADAEERCDFIKAEFAQTNGASKRWELEAVSEKTGKDAECEHQMGLDGQPLPLKDVGAITVKFQDIAVMDATPQIKTLAFGPPITVDDRGSMLPLAPRTLRALALAYGVANIPEQINRAPWGSAHITNENFVFSVAEDGNFGVTRDDALWLMRTLVQLDEDEYQDIVARAVYPSAVAANVAELLIVNRDSFARALRVDVPVLKLKKEKRLPKLAKREFPGYASEFVGEDQESPLRHFEHYLLSMAENNILSNLVSIANRELPSLDLRDGLEKHLAKLDRLARAGQAPAPLSFHVWAAPLIDGGFDISRNIALGAYLGTNNQIQLADTFGIHLNAGIVFNTDPLPHPVQLQGLVQGGVAISLTHVKPLRKLTQATHTPLYDVFVPMFFARLKAIFRRAGDLEGEPGTTQQLLAQELDHITRYLPVGDSLILTESLTGVEQLSAQLGLPLEAGPNVGASVGASQLVLSRVQIYRKSATQIQVFKDRGSNFAWNVSLGANVWNSLPVVRLSARNIKGQGDVRIFNLNISPDPVANPQVYFVAHGIAQLLRTGSTELLESRVRPASLNAVFKDRPRSFQVLQKVRRQLKTTTETHTEIPDQPDGDFIALSNGRQRGNHYQLLSTQIANYWVQRLTESPDYDFETQNNPNPGQSILGESRTRDAQFQGRIGHELTDSFVSIQYRFEGWQKSSKNLQKILDELNTKYRLPVSDPAHVPFFNEESLSNASGMQLYNLSLNLNLYEPALQALLGMSEADRGAYVSKYRKEHRCLLNLNEVCAATSRFDCYSRRAQRTDLTPQQKAEAIFIAAASFERFASFEDLVNAAGGVANLYVSAALTGFRQHSEALDPIRSNSFGSLPPQDPDGILETIRTIFGIENGEFQMKWMRDIL